MDTEGKEEREKGEEDGDIRREEGQLQNGNRERERGKEGGGDID